MRRHSTWGERTRQGLPWCLQAKEPRGLPASPGAGEEPGAGSALELSGRAWPCLRWAVRLLGSRMVKKETFVILSYPVCPGSLGETMQSPSLPSLTQILGCSPSPFPCVSPSLGSLSIIPLHWALGTIVCALFLGLQRIKKMVGQFSHFVDILLCYTYIFKK